MQMVGLMPTLEYCEFLPFYFFNGSDFVYQTNFLGVSPFSKYCKLSVFLFPSITAHGDQNAAFYSKIYGVTPSFLFCSAFMNWGFGENTNTWHPLNSSAGRLQSEEALWTKIVFLSCLCIARHTVGSWFMIATETVQLCRVIMQACWIKWWRSFDFS